MKENTKKKKIFKIIKKIFPLVLVVLVMWFLFVKPKGKTAVVKKISIENRTVERTVSASGKVDSENSVDLAFATSGIVQSINVKKGDYVSKGTLLAYVKPTTQYQTTQAYKDARDQAQREVDLYIWNKEDLIDSLGGETEYELSLRKLREVLSQAEATYQAQLSTLSNYYLYAPFDGTVVEVNKEQNEMATAGETIIQLADLNNLEFKVSLDQEDYGFLYEGQTAEVEFDAYTNVIFNGSVKKLPLTASTLTDAFEIDISIENKEENPARLGMNGDAHIILSKTESEVPSLTIGEFFFDANDDPFVWVARDGVVYQEYIEIGLEGDIYSEIKSTIEGDIVIPMNGSKNNIEEGFSVKFID